MKFTDVKTLEHLLKEYGGSAVGGGGHGTSAKQNRTVTKKSIASGPDASTSSPTINGTPQKDNEPKEPMVQPVQAKDLTVDPKNKNPMMVSLKDKQEPLQVLSPVDDGDNPEALVVQDKKGKVFAIAKDQEVIEVPEGKLSKIAKRKGKKLKIKDLKGKIKKLSKKRLKEQPEELFEINFNRRNIAKAALDAPVKCGFEAETFFFSVDSRGSSNDIDDMSISDIEYEYGDMPDQVWEDFEDWLYSKGQDEYLDDILNDKVQEFREDEDYLNDFIDSGAGPSSEAIERYKKDFEEEDPKEYENREEDGWEYMNWVREFVEEEYEDEYLDWLKNDIAEDNDLDDEAREAARDDYSVEDWIYDNYSYMSSFLDDYGYEYGSGNGDVEGVADELHTWIRDNSKFDSYPESGDYGDTYTTTSWAVETDSSIEPDEGTGAELISPVFDSPRKMLTEMKSLFDWSEENFGTNNSTGLHVTMSWQGETENNQAQEPNKLKMALLLGDEYLLAEFGRLRNSYTKSQYQNVLKYAEGMKRGDAKSFEQFENMLEKGISSEKFQSIHFKTENDNDSGNQLIEFRIAGGVDYNTMYEKVVKACVRYATIMKAGWDKDAFRKEYVNAVFRLLRKSQEIDPKKLKDLEVVNHEVIDAAKGIVGKKDYFDVIKMLSTSVEYFQNYEKLSSPDADKEWKQEIKDYEKGTGSKVEIEEETIRGYLTPNSMAPSKRAAGELKKSQERFGRAITLLARDIADGNNRGPVSAKNIGIFRKFAKEIKLDTKEIEKLGFSSIDDLNFGGSDKEKVARLKKGLNKLFKLDIVKEPEYLAAQNLDDIASKMWQFYQTDDVNDNEKTDKLADLFVNLTPKNDKVNVLDVLRSLTQERSQNGFVAKLKGSGWNTNTTLLQHNTITSKGSADELLKFLEPYSGYSHPTSKDHHVNIKSDDPYADVAQMALVQKMKIRLDHLGGLKDDEPEKYTEIKDKLIKLGEQFINTIKSTDAEIDSDNEPGDWSLNLSQRNSENALNFLASAKELEGVEDVFNFLPSYDDRIIREPLSLLRVYYKHREMEPSLHKQPKVKALIKTNFSAFKKFLTGFDKIFTAQGFTDLKAEISNKDQYDKRNKDFEKNIRDNAKAKLNIPDHSWVYIDKEFFDTITDEDYDDRAAYLDNHIEHFNKQVNNTRVYVIPSSHWSDAEDATNGLELIDTFEKNKNYYHTWRKKGYKRIVNRFNNKYGYSWKHLTDKERFYAGDGDMYSKLKGLGIEITRKGDSRKGAPGQDDLFPDEETQNPKSGEPLNRSSATSWTMNNDEASQKQFDAFDWDQYPAKMKDVVAKVMKQDRYGSFKIALDDVLKKVLDGDVNIDKEDLGKPLDKMAIAAGHDPDDGGSSNGIASNTDWGNLADHLGIERGVNDQGVELLRKVYAQYDGDHNWRPAETDEDGQNVIGLKRWGAAVREAEKYIRDNYNVSGGNYFRKNVDGSDGDDVSAIYSTPAYTPDADYDRARNDYYMFNDMMSAGMQNYLKRGEVNNLVAFLNNTDNSNNFKQNVLRTLISRANNENGPFATFQDALANTRRTTSGNESVLQKFDKLTLEEQLRIVEKSTILEKLSKKSEGPASNALPDNSIPHLLNKLLSQPMPAGDLKKQMDAYWAIPVPQMLSDFRAVRGTGGDRADVRNVLKGYINSQLDPSIRKQVKLVENKDDVIDKIRDLPDNDDQTDKIVSYIEQLLNDMGVGGRLASLTNQLDQIDDKEVKSNQLKIAKIIASIDMTPLERAQLFAMWKKDSLIDTEKLLKGGRYVFSDVFKGYGTEVYMTDFVDDLSNVVNYGIGAGEFLLTVMSNKVTGIGSGKGKGDLIIDNKHVELKTKTEKNARFKDWNVQPDQTWASKVEGFKRDFADIDEVANAKSTGMNSSNLIQMLQNPALQNDLPRKRQALRSIMGIFQATNPTLSVAQITELSKLLLAGNDVNFKQVYGRYNILNYLNVKRSDGDLDGILFMNKQTKSLHYVRDLQEMKEITLDVGTIYPVSTNAIYPYPQIGVK